MPLFQETNKTSSAKQQVASQPEVEQTSSLLDRNAKKTSSVATGDNKDARTKTSSASASSSDIDPLDVSDRYNAATAGRHSKRSSVSSTASSTAGGTTTNVDTNPCLTDILASFPFEDENDRIYTLGR